MMPKGIFSGFEDIFFPPFGDLAPIPFLLCTLVIDVFVRVLPYLNNWTTTTSRAATHIWTSYEQYLSVTSYILDTHNIFE